MDNFTTTTEAPIAIHTDQIWGRHQFLHESPGLAIPCIVVLAFASFVGTLGNVLVIVAVATQKSLQNKESTFIVNLAISDLYITTVADPMGIVAKLEGEQFFDSIPGLCQTIASICTVSCIVSLGSIACLSFNRYIHICHNRHYNRIFTGRNCVIICGALYVVGITMVLLNLTGIGDHGFDRKSLECIWDRMATFPYTVVFSVTLVWVPVLVTGISYINLYIYVLNSQKRVQQYSTMTPTSENKDHDKNESEKTNHPDNHSNQPFIHRISVRKSLHLARTIFVVYAVFSICWIPFAILMVVDTHNTFAHAVHLYITVFAHLHPSLNWLVYYATNKKFAVAFDKLLFMNKWVPRLRPAVPSLHITASHTRECHSQQ
ncbi:melatonin receptor type 1B-B-like [Mizuhopecten yessoensis]|uniref:Melatonin receptor type 1C n=1 Tax=Mizuhopecten yessoensis TaxID=6573 RepID=A0A210Q5I2_MIZYE|nr:melatonin receptor type 1B-B-like [Mizuhopecten yessoensis]OWF44003.1 Melatonin receptor type 1C [Mizuhopecten yessoensis]